MLVVHASDSILTNAGLMSACGHGISMTQDVTSAALDVRCIALSVSDTLERRRPGKVGDVAASFDIFCCHFPESLH